MSSHFIRKTVFDVEIDIPKNEARTKSDMLFDKHILPALEKVLWQFENIDMVIAQPLELDLGAITEGDLEHSIADKLYQALLKYRHDDTAPPVSARIIEPETDMLFDYLQKPVPPWSIDNVEDFDLRQLLDESAQKAMVSDVYLEQMATLLSDGIETCKRFFGLPFQQDDFSMLLQRLISKSPVLRSRIAPEVVNLCREDNEMDCLLFKEIMHYLFSCALFGTKQEIIFSQMVVALLGNRRWRSGKSIGQVARGRNVNDPLLKMVSAQDQCSIASVPSSGVSDVSGGRPAASVPSFSVVEAKEQAEEAPSGFHDLYTEPVAGSDTVLGFSRTSGGGDESPEIISDSENAILGQGATESDRLGEKLQRLIRHINKIVKDGERFFDVIAEIERIIEELQCDEQWKRLLECNESSTHALQKELLRLKNRTEEGPNGANGLSNADNVTEEDVLQIAKAIESLRKIETMGWQEEAGMGIRELATAVMRIQPEIKERIPVYNAGLVLFHPFLISFFDKLGLLEYRKHFKSAAYQIRAAHLLHELSGFRKDSLEHLMLFNKLLCGINITFPINAGFKISENEKQEAEKLLKAVICNWSIIKNTSVTGFQESFVCRRGALERSDRDWILRVETKGIDILLDDIPWNIHIISFPWNDFLIHVDWKL